jgi:hypothetical protein
VQTVESPYVAGVYLVSHALVGAALTMLTAG